ncbi:MAG: hypothetical protein AVDCRST_MAG05-4940, partial [uncultured Rubrobacteraceae bacterium]
RARLDHPRPLGGDGGVGAEGALPGGGLGDPGRARGGVGGGAPRPLPRARARGCRAECPV